MIIEDCLELVGDFVFSDSDITNPGLIVDWLGRGNDVCNMDGELLRLLASLEKLPVPDCLDGRENEQGWTMGAKPPTTVVPGVGDLQALVPLRGGGGAERSSGSIVEPDGTVFSIHRCMDPLLIHFLVASLPCSGIQWHVEQDGKSATCQL